jgi:hypothetical protein
MSHRVYEIILRKVKAGALREPFSVRDFRVACPGLGPGTYEAFLYKHRQGNPGRNSELFLRVSPGRFRCIRPFRYGL